MKKLYLLLLLLMILSCTKKEYVLSVGKPHKKELKGLKMDVFIDGSKIYSENLEITKIASIFNDVTYDNPIDSSELKVIIGDKEFNYSLEYPKDKYIILSPTFHTGEIGLGIKKSDKKFNHE